MYGGGWGWSDKAVRYVTRYGKYCRPALPVFQVANTMQYVWAAVALI